MKRIAAGLGVITVIALLLSADYGDSDLGGIVFEVVLAGWCFSPWAALASDRLPLGNVVRALGIGASAVVGMLAFAAIDDSSTGALALLFLPVYQWVIVGVVALVEGVATLVRRRRRSA